MDICNEIRAIMEKMPYFLEKMILDKDRGTYKYSYSGDSPVIEKNGCIGSSVFALKIAYTLGVDKNHILTRNAIKYLQNSQEEKGYFYDKKVMNSYI